MDRKRIVLASNNPGKVREIEQLAAGQAIEILSQAALKVPEVEETGQTFVENAILKARHAASQTKLPAIADDSGLIVDGLQGMPGVYSARYAGNNASDADNLAKLINAVKSLPEQQRSAYFVCVMAYLRYPQDPCPIMTEATWPGQIITKPVGNNGFGYDPVFYLPSHHCTSAELPPATKNALSHRGQALRALLNKLILPDASKSPS